MAEEKKSEEASDNEKKQREEIETAESSGAESETVAMADGSTIDAPPPSDPLERARTEMEEVAGPWQARDGADSVAQDDGTAPDPTDPVVTSGADDGSDTPSGAMPEETAGERWREGDDSVDGQAADPEAGDGDKTPRPWEDETDTNRPEELEDTVSTPAEAAAATTAGEIRDDLRDEPEAERREPGAERVTAPAPVAPQVVRGSIWPGVFGGVIAALFGFIVGRGEVLDEYLPAALQRPAVDTSAIEAQAAAATARAEELAAQSSELAARLDALETAGSGQAPVDLSQIEAQLTESLEALVGRIDALENLAGATDGAAPAVSSEAVDALQSALEAQSAEIAALSQRAAEAEERAAGEAARLLARAALMRVQSAVDTGSAFAPELTELEEVTPVTVPDPLRAVADTGVPTLAELQGGFPDAARAGLAAARAEVPESEVDGLGGFLRRQFNVRSTAPREGSDPDAVLSRAQAALEAGDLDAALTEMEALPDAARSAMDDWLEAASARKAAQDAAAELADSLNSN